LHDGSIEQVDQASVDTMLEHSPQKEQIVEGLAVASEDIEYVGVEEPLEVENVVVAIEDIGVEKTTEVENVDATECVASKLESISEASVVLNFQSNSIFNIVVLLGMLLFQLVQILGCARWKHNKS
jgi:hypothetical protein